MATSRSSRAVGTLPRRAVGTLPHRAIGTLPRAVGALPHRAATSFRSPGRAHAAVRGYTRLTRDPRRYRAYVPTLRVIAPGDGG